MTDTVTFIADRTAKYAALQKLTESGEGFESTARALVVADALIGGQNSDYERIVSVQREEEKLSFETFQRLSDYFYPFRIRPALREILEIFIVLDGFSRSRYAKDFLVNLPESQRHPGTREEMILSYIKYGMIPEVERLSLSSLDILRHAFQYREAVREQNQQIPAFACSDSEQRIVFAGVVCDIGGLVSNANLSGSLTLTEAMANDLLFLLDNKADPKMTTALCQLSG